MVRGKSFTWGSGRDGLWVRKTRSNSLGSPCEKKAFNVTAKWSIANPYFVVLCGFGFSEGEVAGTGAFLTGQGAGALLRADSFFVVGATKYPTDSRY